MISTPSRVSHHRGSRQSPVTSRQSRISSRNRTLTRISLIILRSARIQVLLEFYRALGLSFVEEQHGKGPIHYSCDIDGTILEIYPGEEGVAPHRQQGGATMLGFTVSSLNVTLTELNKLGINLVSPPKESTWGRRAVVADPDGRAIDLTESKA